MTISSRTPDGQPNRCPVCGSEIRIQPSQPAGDAPCPACGVLLWFVAGDQPGAYYFDARSQPAYEVETTVFTAMPPRPIDPVSVAHVAALRSGQRARIVSGTFANYAGPIREIDCSTGRVTIEVNIFGREVPVEVESCQATLADS